jgi:hypothetical protein
MGKSIPVIEVNISNLAATGSARDVVNRFAAVASVDYVYETPTVMGVPEGILEQINYTLDTDTQRPEDRFQIWEMNLTGDYSIEKLKTDTAQADGKLDKEKLAKFVTGVGDRMKILQKDFNLIKGIFYKGEIAEADRKRPVGFKRRAVAVDTEEETRRPEEANYLVKTVDVVAHAPTPNSTNPDAESGTTATGATAGNAPTEADAIIINILKPDDALNRWKAYGLTPLEKRTLKETPVRGANRITLSDGSTISIDGVNWGPGLADKLRVILPIGSERKKSIFNPAAYRKTTDSFKEYYGEAPNRNDNVRFWGASNKKRIGEILALTQTIKELERKNSKVY